MDCFQWLLRHVPFLRDRLMTTSPVRDKNGGGTADNGPGSLGRQRAWIHYAAKYGQVRQEKKTEGNHKSEESLKII